MKTRPQSKAVNGKVIIKTSGSPQLNTTKVIALKKNGANEIKYLHPFS